MVIILSYYMIMSVILNRKANRLFDCWNVSPTLCFHLIFAVTLSVELDFCFKYCQVQHFVFINGEISTAGCSRRKYGVTSVHGGPPAATQARPGCSWSPPLPLSAAFQNPLQPRGGMTREARWTRSQHNTSGYQLPAAVHVDLNDQLAGSITGSKERGNRRRHNAEQQKNM